MDMDGSKIKTDLKKCNLFENLAMDRLAWGNIIHVADHNIVAIRL